MPSFIVTVTLGLCDSVGDPLFYQDWGGARIWTSREPDALGDAPPLSGFAYRNDQSGGLGCITTLGRVTLADTLPCAAGILWIPTAAAEQMTALMASYREAGVLLASWPVTQQTGSPYIAQGLLEDETAYGAAVRGVWPQDADPYYPAWRTWAPGDDQGEMGLPWEGWIRTPGPCTGPYCLGIVKAGA